GHGVLGKDLGLYARETLHWLDKLHDAYDLCRDFFHTLHLESDDPAGGPLTWGQEGPLPFYHAHEPAGGGPRLCGVRVRTEGGAAIELTPLLSVQRCGVCAQWAAFYLDRYESGKQRSWFLDFVEGHSHDRRDVAALRAWAERVRAEDAAAAAAM